MNLVLLAQACTSVMGCKSHHAMLDPYCGGTTCTRAAGSVLLRAKLTRGVLHSHSSEPYKLYVYALTSFGANVTAIKASSLH